jgi:hypothetical protein
MMKRNLEQDCSETKISRFKLRKSKKFWTTTSVILGSIGVVLGLITITPEKNVVYAATPPTSGTVTWTPNNSLAEITLKSGKSEKIAFLQFDSIPSYCIALGVPLTNSSTSAQQDKLNEIWSKLQAKEQAMINDIVYFANNQGAANNKNLYLGAQTAIWQYSLNVNVVLDGSLKIVKKQTDQDSHQGSGNIAGAKFDVTMYLSDGKTVDTGIDGTFDTVDSNGKKTGTVQVF